MGLIPSFEVRMFVVCWLVALCPCPCLCGSHQCFASILWKFPLFLCSLVQACFCFAECLQVLGNATEQLVQ